MKTSFHFSVMAKHLLALLLCVPVSATNTRAAAVSAVSLGSIKTASIPAPVRLCTDPAGNLYVADSQSQQVAVFDPFGRLLSTKAGLANPLAIAVDGAGAVFVAEAGIGRVSIFNAQWTSAGALGRGNGEFGMPSHLRAISEAGGTTVYVSDSFSNRVSVYRNGAKIRTIGGPAQLSFPAGILVDASNTVFVVDQGNDRIQVFDSSGALMRSISLKSGGSGVISGRSQGICGDTQGRLYVADTFQGYVRVFDAAGTFLGYLGGYGPLPGQLCSPTDLALDGMGRLYAASLNNGRVEIFGVDCFTHLVAVPPNPVVGQGSTIVLAVVSSCKDGPWQWRKDGSNLMDGGNIAGATSSNLTISAASVGDSGSYNVVVGTNLSVSALVTVVSAPVITQQPIGAYAPQGGMAIFQVQASGANLSYQWLLNGSSIIGATGSRLVLSDSQPTDRGNYSVRVSNPAGSVTSVAVPLNLTEAPQVLFEPVSQSAPERANVSFVGGASGSVPITYQWYSNGVAVSGATSISLMLTNVTPAFNGGYSLVAMNSAGSATSHVASLTVSPDTIAPVALSVAPARLTNQSITLSFSKNLAAASATNLTNYAILGGAINVTGATLLNGTNVTLRLSGARLEGVNYRVRVADVFDTAYFPNRLAPNPTILPILPQVDLVTINGTTWRYFQTTLPTGLDGVAWKSGSFNDSAWQMGSGIFYGNRTNSVSQPAPNPAVRLPLVLSSSDPLNNQALTILNVFTNAANAIQEITYYFRTTFNFPAETTNGASLLIRSIIDDGAVIYVNGQEVRRDRMPSGTPTYATYASGSGSQAWSPTITSAPRVIGINGLQPGTNVLAVELHQRNSTDDDVTLGIWLEAVIAGYPTQPGGNEDPITLNIVRPAAYVGTNVTLYWESTGCLLEAATNPAGPWTVVASNPPVIVPARDAEPAKFFRLRR